jgi:hypothetical protein
MMFLSQDDVLLEHMKPKLRLALAFLLSSIFIACVGFAFDHLLLREGVPRLGVLFLSNALTGLVAGALFLQSKVRAQEKHRLLEERLQKVAEMNHHVRNALQVVAFYRDQISDPRAGRLIQESIDRIQWTLEEVLPRGWNLDSATVHRPHASKPFSA